MSTLVRIIALLAAFIGFGAHAQQTLLDRTLTLGKKPDAVELMFTLTATSDLKLTATDFGTATGPKRMGRFDVGLVRGSELVASIGIVSTGANTANKTVTGAPAGDYRVIIIGQPASPSTVGSGGVRVDNLTTATVPIDTLQTFIVPPPPTASPASFEHELTVPAGNYMLETSDFVLPQALSVLRTTVFRKSTGDKIFDVAGSTIPPLSLTGPDVYQVFLEAELATNVAHGLFGISLRDTASGATQFAEVHEIGAWPFKHAFTVASATTLTAALNDLRFPNPLARLGAVVVRDGRVAMPKITGSGNSSGALAAGAYTAYVDAAPATAGAGSYGLRIADAGNQPLKELVQNVVAPGPVTDVQGIDTGFDVQTAGDYTLTLTDFGLTGFFDAFASLGLGLSRDNEVVKTLTAAGSFTFAATPGHYSLAILADPAGTSGEGLLGVRVHGGPADAVVYDVTAAVGTDFISTTVDVATAQRINVVLSDLAFPGTFASVKVGITRGTERVYEAQLVAGNLDPGSSSSSFEATPGKYLVNLLAATGTANYGTVGVKLATAVAPTVPTVTLTSSRTSVDPGGTAVLTWSSTGTDSCVASGGWTGTRATNGGSTVGPLNANTHFTLACTGAGGRAEASVDIAINSAQRSGGGGGTDGVLLALLGIAAGATRVLRRRATLAA